MIPDVSNVPLSPAALAIDAASECSRIEAELRRALARELKRRGLIVALSGGVDSTVTAALAARALGRERVLGVLMPERHSSPATRRLGQLAAAAFGIAYVEEDITGVLEAVGFYRRYDEAVREVVPEFGDGWVSKVVIEGVSTGSPYTTFAVIAQDVSGNVVRKRLPLKAYLAVVAATNFKQRTRKMIEYYHADRLHYAVAGTPNRLEYDQGFFVKNGDGSADVKPIAHLYKTQVYQLAAYLGVPQEISQRPPTTDTYSMAQGQDEFYFAVPYEQMDICLLGKNLQASADDVAGAAGLTRDAVERIWTDIDRKRVTTRYLHLGPILCADTE